MPIASGILLAKGDAYVAKFKLIVGEILVEYTFTFGLAVDDFDVSSHAARVSYTNLNQLANGEQIFRAQFGKTEFKMTMLNDVEIRGTLDNHSRTSMASNGTGVWNH